MTQAQSLQVPAGLSYFGVRFRPGMAEHFVPGAAQLNDRRVALADLTQSRELLARLCDCGRPEQMAAVMNEYLRPEKEIDAGSEMVLQLSSTTTSIDELVAQSSWSGRHFRRRRLSQVGVSPKFLSRILRFRKATDRIAKIRSGQPNWAHFAVACGYYDQAHFIREFQSFTGSTPARFFEAQRPPETSRKVPVT